MGKNGKEYHHTGIFSILNEDMAGELIHNEENGIILLNLAKKLNQDNFMGKSYANLSVIYGNINSGEKVTLFNCECINNHSNVGQSQRISYRCKYFIWSNHHQKKPVYNEMVCTLKNAFSWSQLSVFEQKDDGIALKKEHDECEFNWFGVKIRFTVFSNETFWLPLDSEEKKIVQRVCLSIVSDQKQSIDKFIDIRDKVLALISFAIKGNVNIEEEYLMDYEDSYLIGEKITDYHKYYLVYSQRELAVWDSNVWDYNFTLKQLPKERDLNDDLEKLTPVFNLYLSLFKYRDMPIEMIFLNIVQALETFHSRFYYDDKKKNYIESVNARFSGYTIKEKILGKLLTDGQNRSSYIILVSRINDLLIGEDETLFYEYWSSDDDFGQRIADTRHYYTHYGKSKEEKALKGDDLREAIFVLSRLLEYHVCKVLGIDIRDKICNSFNSHHAWKQLEEHQNKQN